MSIAGRIKEDIDTIRQKDPAARGIIEILFCYPGLHAVLFYRVSHRFWIWKLYFIGRLLSHIARFLTGVEIHPGAVIGHRFFIDHGMGVVIGETTVIGDDVTIYHGVTLGGVSLKKTKRHPTIEDGVVIGAGAKVLGPFTVGKNARIGANSVVVKPVRAGSTVTGIPAVEVSTQDKASELRHDQISDPVAFALKDIISRLESLEKNLIND